jgi:hypothetical protein
MLVSDTVSSVLILRLSRILWSICFLTWTHVTVIFNMQHQHSSALFESFHSFKLSYEIIVILNCCSAVNFISSPTLRLSSTRLDILRTLVAALRSTVSSLLISKSTLRRGDCSRCSWRNVPLSLTLRYTWLKTRPSGPLRKPLLVFDCTLCITHKH